MFYIIYACSEGVFCWDRDNFQEDLNERFEDCASIRPTAVAWRLVEASSEAEAIRKVKRMLGQ